MANPWCFQSCFNAETSPSQVTTLSLSYDGDGRQAREAVVGGASPSTYYMVRSSVLGGEVLTRLTAAGAKAYTYVPAGGLVQARQTIDRFSGQEAVEWTHRDPLGTSEPGGASDPLGLLAVPDAPEDGQPIPPSSSYGPSYTGSSSMFSNANNYSTGCRLDGRPMDCNRLAQVMNNGWGEVSLNDLRPDTVSPNGRLLPPRTGGFIQNSSRTEGVPGDYVYIGGRQGDEGFTTTIGYGPGSQNTGAQSSNPNCIMNAVSGANKSLSRPFGNVGKSGTIGHDGVHVKAPPGSIVKTLAPLAGRVIGNPRKQGASGADAKLYMVDVLLNNGNVAIYKDLATVNVRNGQRLSAGTVIGTLGAGSGESDGLHFALLKGGLRGLRSYRDLTSRIASLDNSDDFADWNEASRLRDKIKVNMFINPLGANSPVNCPGVPVNNEGIEPYPGG